MKVAWFNALRLNQIRCPSGPLPGRGHATRDGARRGTSRRSRPPVQTSRTSLERVHTIGHRAVRAVHQRICTQTQVRMRVLAQGNDPQVASFVMCGGLPNGCRGTNSSTMCPLLRGRLQGLGPQRSHAANSAALSPCDCSLLGRSPTATLVVPGYRRSPFGGRQRHRGCSCRCREQTWSPVRPGRSP